MNRKERLVNFRITEEQYYVLRQRAAAEGVAVSEYVRSRLIRDEKAAALEARVAALAASLAAELERRMLALLPKGVK